MIRIDTDSLAAKERIGTQRILTTDGHGWAQMNRRKQSLETLHFPGLLQESLGGCHRATTNVGGYEVYGWRS